MRTKLSRDPCETNDLANVSVIDGEGGKRVRKIKIMVRENLAVALVYIGRLTNQALG